VLFTATFLPYVAIVSCPPSSFDLELQNNILIDSDRNVHLADHGILAMCSELSGTSYIRNNVRWAAPELFEVPEDEES
jgi:hypothetical protein